MPSLADVSLQTGQSLLANEIVEKPQQLTKQTSTNQIPIATECHSLTTQTVDTVHPAMESIQTQETIKILKTTEGDHDVIEIATKNVPTSAQEIVQDRPEQITEDIVVDMKYQDPTNTDNTTSELNIVHAAPQSFETVLVEPDDVITEVVVDEDGSKRIIVRKLRRTTMTNRQTTQQHLSSTSTAIGDAPSVVQAFSEATMKDQQVTITTTKPDGTIETVTKQIHGGRVATGTPFKDVNVDEYESSPQYMHTVTQGNIRDISPQPFEEGILMEGGEYRAKTSSVHAVVQQVTRRVVRKTKRIIRKVTIIDGKETATEEIIEEPEEVEIDEKNIPHISINVIKQEEQRNLNKDEEKIEEKAPDRVVVEDVTEKEDKEDRDSKVEKVVTDDIPMQGPFFGAFAKDMHPSTTYLVTEREEPLPDKKDTLTKEKKEEKIDINIRSEKALENPLEFSDIQESLQGLEESLLQSEKSDKSLKAIEKKIKPTDKYEHEHFLVEVNGKKFLQSTSQAFIDAEVSATLQSPSQEIKIRESQIQEELTKSSIESIVSEDSTSVTKGTCKFIDAPVSRETPRIEVEDRTVDVEKHHDIRGTVDVPVLEEKSSIEKWMKEKSESLTKLASTEVQKRVHVSEERPIQFEEIFPSTSTPAERKRHVELEALPIDVKQQIVKNSFVPEIDYSIDDYMDEALKPEYKPIFHKVEISLAVKREGEEMQPIVSVKSQSEPEAAPYRLVKEDVDIRLPADKESISVIHDKIVQTSPPMIEAKIIGLDKSVGGSEKEIVTSDKSVVTSEKEETDKSIVTSEKEIVTSEKEETDKSIITSEKEEISDHVVTSEKEDECLTEPTVEPEAEAITQLDKKIEKRIESPMLSTETKSSVSLASNIGDSMEIDVPLSDSSRHASEAPQPDIAKMFESREVELYLKEETSEGEDGYEADRTIVTTTPDDETVTKTKRRKKKKQRVRSCKDEEQTEFPKTTTDDGEFTDDETLAESEDAKATKKKKKKKKREEIDFGKEKIVPTMIVADTQTLPREFSVFIATSPKQEEVSEIYIQTSPHLLEDVKLKIEEIHEEVQTSPPISLEESEKPETPKVKEVHAEMQTSPLPASDFGMQTVPEEKESEPEKPIIQHSEMQTSPLPASDFSGQTVEEEAPKIEEISTQTMESPIKKMEEYAVQTSPVEDIKPEVVPIETEEIQVQTVATEVASIEAQTSPTAPSMEIETQTVEKVVVAVEQQTTPPPIEEKILTGIAVQTVTPEVPKTTETEAQTSKPTTPEITTLDFNVQADLIEQPVVDVVETQTTPEESPRQAETHETESQTIQPEPTQEIMIQTCPVTFAPEKVEVCELSSQTSMEEVKESIDEQSQTMTPEKIETLDSSVQIKTSELIEQIEESVQIIPETREESEQTSIEEKKPLLVTSSQQTNGALQVAESEKEFVVEDEEGNLVEAMIDEVDASTEIKAPLILTEIPVAPDVQVQETKEYMDTKIEKVTEPVSVIEEPLNKIEEPRDESSQGISDITEPKSESEETMMPSLEETETADAEFEIRLQATIELCPDETTDTTSKLTDTSRDTTITEDLSITGKVEDSSVVKRQKRKRRHKTIEISATSEKDLESIFGQPVESKDVSLKLSYSDVAKKNVSKEKSPPREDVEKDVEKDESVRKESPEFIPEESMKEAEEKIETAAIPLSIATEPIVVKEIQDVWTLRKEKIVSPMESEVQQMPVISTHTPSPEPMDTTEEPFSPVESIPQEDDRPRIKTYADIISESSKKPEKDQPSTWELSQHVVPQKGASSKAFLIAESAEYEPQHQITQSSQTTKAISDRMQSFLNAKQSSHLGNILHIAHLDKVANEKLAEERAADIRKELSHLRNAAQEKDAITVEETLVVIVDTISTWLETIEYRIFLSKECPTGPSHDDQTYVELRDEVENVEENIQELNNVWKLVEMNYPREDRNNLQECLDALMHQVKMIEDATDDGEKYLTNELARWDEFVNGVYNMYK